MSTHRDTRLELLAALQAAIAAAPAKEQARLATALEDFYAARHSRDLKRFQPITTMLLDDIAEACDARPMTVDHPDNVEKV
jgi:hypothetical protein